MTARARRDDALLPRRRQVRFSYPPDVAALCAVLARRHPKNRIAAQLELPLSTVYRWLDGAPCAPALATDEAQRAEECTLLQRCADQGFDFGAAVLRLHAQPAGGGHAKARAAALTALERVRIHIDHHYYRELGCEALARSIGATRFNFIRNFSHAFGMSPYRYLLTVRVRHALQLVRSTAQPLGAVAMAVGFNETSSLLRACKSVEGVTLAALVAAHDGHAGAREFDTAAAA